MFGLQASQIRGAKTIDELAQILAGCGPLSRNVLDGNFHLFSNSKPDGAGFDDGVLILDQYNPGSKSHALWVRNGSSRFDGDVYIQNLKAARLATASADWTNVAAPNIPFVDATDDATGAAVRIYLPRTSQRDPNVRNGDKVAYMWGWDNKAYAISDYLDDKIGTIKIWSGNVADIPPGWALCDGVANAAGSGYDLSARFVKGGNTPGVTGGSSSHTHAAHPATNTDTKTTGVGVNSASSGVTVASAKTGITVDDHTDCHAHGISPTLVYVEQGAYSTVQVYSSPIATDSTCPVLAHTVNDPAHSHAVSDPGHSHGVSDAGHYHTVPQLGHDTVNHEPPFMVLAYIERIS